ncbi:hypothetical protein ACFX1X_023453 [Malus domestica]
MGSPVVFAQLSVLLLSCFTVFSNVITTLPAIPPHHSIHHSHQIYLQNTISSFSLRNLGFDPNLLETLHDLLDISDEQNQQSYKAPYCRYV